jgi:hypothetical protein
MEWDFEQLAHIWEAQLVHLQGFLVVQAEAKEDE